MAKGIHPGLWVLALGAVEVNASVGKDSLNAKSSSPEQRGGDGGTAGQESSCLYPTFIHFPGSFKPLLSGGCSLAPIFSSYP